MSGKIGTSPLETAQRERFYAAAAAAGRTREEAQGIALRALRRAPRTERASTTFRKLAQSFEHIALTRQYLADAKAKEEGR